MKLVFEWLAEAFKVLMIVLTERITLKKEKKEKLITLEYRLHEAKTQKELDDIFNEYADL